MSSPNAIYSQALSNPLVAEALFIAQPAWVWSTSGENILWSNEAGCRFFDTKSLPDLLSRTFRRVSPATVQIARMATNTEIGTPLKSTLKFFQAMKPITIDATLERIQLTNGQDAIFVRAEHTIGKAKSYSPPKDHRRLMKLFSRGDAAAALLSIKGKVKEASNAFHDADIDKAFLRKAARSLKNHYSTSLTLPDEDHTLHLSVLRDADGAASYIFAALSDVKNETPLEKAPHAVDISDEAPVKTQDTISDTAINEAEEVVFIDDEIDSKTDRETGSDETREDALVANLGADDNDGSQEDKFTFISKETPTRFLFTLNAHQDVTTLSPEIVETLGSETGDILGQNWADVSKRFNMDPTGTIARKIKRESIWTETIYWPISGTASSDGDEKIGPLRAPVTMTAMPIFNSGRKFEGFRGFGSIETTNVTVHADLDMEVEVEADEAGETGTSSEEWEKFIATTPLPDDETTNEAQNVDDEDQPEEDELRWSEDYETEEKNTLAELFERNQSSDDENNKVVPLHRRPIGVPTQPTEDETASLSKPERTAFKQIADALSARLDGDKEENQDENIDLDAASIIEGHTKPATTEKPKKQTIDERAAEILDDTFIAKSPDPQSTPSKSNVAKGLGAGAAAILGSNAGSGSSEHPDDPDDNDNDSDLDEDKISAKAETITPEMRLERDSILNRLPLGLIVSRHRDVLFANQSVLDFLGYDDVQSFEDAGGINTLFQADTQTDPGSFVGRDILKHLVIKADHQEGHIPQAVRAKMADGTTAAVDLRLQSGEWQGSDALLMALTAKTDTTYTGASDGERMSDLLGQSTDVMDIASDGILIIDETGKLIHANSSAEALFDRDRSKMRGLKITTLFAEESQKSIQDYLDGLTSNGVASVLNDGRELIAQESNGGLIPLFITIGRLEKNERFADGVFCVVLRDITQWKRAEEELLESRRIAENANAQKSDFLAAISHEIRTPLNAIIGFSEVMMEQHYGPMENPRYLEYARDINASGNHLMSLVNDLLDLSKIEAGKLDLTFSSVILNTVIQECVALMQPDANKDRIIIRTSLMESLPPVVADMRSIRQIALNLLSNAVKFTKAGGQVIISTTLDENGEVAIRVRDTGIGMSEDDLQYALQPFRQVEVDQKNRKPGTGLGLPLTKALVEANRARFIIDSRVNYGTLIQVVFPNERVLAR
ncbi:MAG: PAS domain-containing sensor histidine kinase [Hyphomicrobiales bacterium]